MNGAGRASSPYWATGGEGCEGPRTGSSAGTGSRRRCWRDSHCCLCCHTEDSAAVRCLAGCACPCGSTVRRRPER